MAARLKRDWFYGLVASAMIALAIVPDGCVVGFRRRDAAEVRGRALRATERASAHWPGLKMGTAFAVEVDRLAAARECEEFATPTDQPRGRQEQTDAAERAALEGRLRGIRGRFAAAGLTAETIAAAERIPVAMAAAALEGGLGNVGLLRRVLSAAEAVLRGVSAGRPERPAAIVETAVVAVARRAVELVARTRTIGLLTGPAGCGKTFALLSIAATMPNVVHVTADPDARSVRGVLAAIADGAGMAEVALGRLTVRAVVEGVRQRRPVIVLDEAQRLSPAALDCVRAVFDRGDCGVLLCGTASVARNTSAESDPLLRPLVSRIGLRADLSNELVTAGKNPWLTRAGFCEILAAAGHVVTSEANELLYQVALAEPGYLRRALLLARIAQELIASGEAIDAESLRLAVSLGGATDRAA